MGIVFFLFCFVLKVLVIDVIIYVVSFFFVVGFLCEVFFWFYLKFQLLLVKLVVIVMSVMVFVVVIGISCLVVNDGIGQDFFYFLIVVVLFVLFVFVLIIVFVIMVLSGFLVIGIFIWVVGMFFWGKMKRSDFDYLMFCLCIFVVVVVFIVVVFVIGDLLVVLFWMRLVVCYIVFVFDFYSDVLCVVYLSDWFYCINDDIVILGRIMFDGLCYVCCSCFLQVEVEVFELFFFGFYFNFQIGEYDFRKLVNLLF